MYDAIVVGARCAGSTVARLLAARHAKVLLVDRATFPSDTLNGHYIQPAGVRQLQTWGLLDRVLDGHTARPLWSVAYRFGDIALKGYLTWPDGEPAMAVAPRRRRLDALLLDAAAEAGAEVRTGFGVDELLWDGDRVVGIRGRQAGGTAVDERATLVIGADGLHSRVAQAVGAPRYAEQPAQTCIYYSHWADFPADGLELYLDTDRYVLLFPSDDGLTCIAIGWRHAQFEHVKRNLATQVATALASVPAVAARIASARRAEPLRGTAELASFLRVPVGPGWALVGDAAWRVDPITGQGISDALRDADLLATAVLRGLTGTQPLAAALATYHATRDRIGLPLYHYTAERARLGIPPVQTRQLLATLQHRQADMDQFAGIAAGITSPAAFFAPDNLARIMGQSTARAA